MGATRGVAQKLLHVVVPGTVFSFGRSAGTGGPGDSRIDVAAVGMLGTVN